MNNIILLPNEKEIIQSMPIAKTVSIFYPLIGSIISFFLFYCHIKTYAYLFAFVSPIPIFLALLITAYYSSYKLVVTNKRLILTNTLIDLEKSIPLYSVTSLSALEYTFTACAPSAILRIYFIPNANEIYQATNKALLKYESSELEDNDQSFDNASKPVGLRDENITSEQTQSEIETLVEDGIIDMNDW